MQDDSLNFEDGPFNTVVCGDCGHAENIDPLTRPSTLDEASIASFTAARDAALEEERNSLPGT